MKNKIAVISTGNGGQAMAAYLSRAGYNIALYARELERVKMFRDNHFTLHGVVEGEAYIDLISCNMEEVIDGAYLIMVTTPAQYHTVVARAMVPYLRDGQVIVLNPGRTFGTYAFERTLLDCKCRADIILAETDTFVFTCRCLETGEPTIYKIKDKINVSAHRSTDTEYVRNLLSELFDNVYPAENVIYTGFTNIGMVFHPLPILMNITRVEAKEDFLFYKQAISPLVAGVLERLDSERCAVANALGADVLTAQQWLESCYGSTGNTLYDTIQSTAAYSNVLAPTDIDTRYVFEDIRTGCVPTSVAGRLVGIKTPIIDAAINWASILYNTNFYSLGRNQYSIDFGHVIRTYRN